MGPKWDSGPDHEHPYWHVALCIRRIWSIHQVKAERFSFFLTDHHFLSHMAHLTSGPSFFRSLDFHVCSLFTGPDFTSDMDPCSPKSLARHGRSREGRGSMVYYFNLSGCINESWSSEVGCQSSLWPAIFVHHWAHSVKSELLKITVFPYSRRAKIHFNQN